MKKLFLYAILLWFCDFGFAQTKFPYDSLSHQVFYKQTFKLGTKVKTDDVFAVAQTWFNDPTRFTQKNTEPPADSIKLKKNKNKAAVDKEFNNSKPLQMLDPAAHKLNAMGLVEYYGGFTTSIKLLYIKYDINLEIKSGICTLSISNLGFFICKKLCTNRLVHNFSGGKPCDGTGRIEGLMECEKFHDEFKGLAVYFNKEMAGLFADFKTVLKKKMFLYDAKAASASPGAKTTARKK